MGVIVRDHEGYVIAAKNLTKLGNLEPAAAEVLGAIRAA